MSLQCGIVGLPNVGKSTLFNALTPMGRGGAEVANFPFCTIDPNVGIVPVPDERLDKLTSLAHPAKVTPAIIEFVDIAGLVKGASEGKGKGNAFLSHIREVDAIIHVVRCFEDEEVVHVEGDVDPIRDITIIQDELIIKDLETIEKRIDRFQKEVKSGDKTIKNRLELVTRLHDFMEQGNPARAFEMHEDEKESIRDLFLLTVKPVLYVCNIDETDLPEGEANPYVEQVRKHALKEDAEIVVVCAKIEAEIAELEEEERMMFLKEMGLDRPGLHRLIRAAFHELGLITYFTAGPKEVRAWTIHRGTKAPQAAGVIHTDFERGFIRAETIKYDDYVSLGSEEAARDAGRMRSEGKEYIVQDGDVMLFRFNV